MGSSSQTKTTQSQTAPWSVAQPALNTALAGAQNAYDTTYQGTGVADKDPLVTQGQNMAVANANTGALGNIGTQAISNTNDMLANGGLSDEQIAQLGGTAGALGQFNSTLGQAQSALNPYVSGQYLNQPNPYLQQAVGTSMQDAADAVNRQFSASGRYGSGANTAVLSKQLGNIANTAYMNDYNQQQQNQLSAANSLGSMASSGLSGNLSGLGQIGAIGQQGITNTFNAAAASPALGTAQNADAATLTNVGGQNMSYQQQLIDAANQNPWTNVGNLAQIAGGIGALGNQSNSTSNVTSDTGLAGILGGGLASLSTLGKLGGLSGIGGLFKLS